MCIAVGKVSLELWLMLAESLGCKGRGSSTPFSAAIWLPRFARTSFMFMLDCVPEPVCHTTSGKLPSSLPARTSSAAAASMSAEAWSMRPRRQLACAAAFFRVAKARMTSTGIVCPPMGKFSWLRCVWAPHKASAGTRISPMESCSMR